MGRGELLLGMPLYWRGHRTSWMFAASIVVSCIALIVSNSALPVPELFNRLGGGAQVDLFLVVLFAPIVSSVFGGDITLLEAAGNRGLIIFRGLLGIALVSPAIAVSTIAGVLGGGEFAWRFSRNTTAVVGIALIALVLGGQIASSSIPTAFVLANAVAGISSSGQPSWWAVLRWSPGPLQAALGLLTFAVGLASYQLAAGRMSAVGRLSSSGS